MENTIEIPTIPETKKGLKFDAAAKEITLISDDFFKIKKSSFTIQNFDERNQE